MRTLFIVHIDHIRYDRRDDLLNELADKLREEFPAYRVVEWIRGTQFATVWVEPFEREVVSPVHGVMEVPVPVHLNGWGTQLLTMRFVG